MRIAAAVALLLAATGAHAAPIDAAIARARFDGAVVAGDADRPAIVRGDARATWRWASVTKQLTALLVMQEVGAGRLALDRPIAEQWPAWPHVFADTITVRHLLQHTSGLADPNEDGPNDPDGMPRFYRPARGHGGGTELATGYCAEHPRAEPGLAFHYNNCDFIVLGALLEHETGQPFATLLSERIARPLRQRIGLFAPGVAPAAHVRGVDTHGRPERLGDLGVYGAAGGAYGSLLALYAVDRALIGHTLLPAADTASMWTGDARFGYAALGQWAFAAPLAGCGTAPVRIVERRGQIGGVQLRNFILPDQGRALILATRYEAFAFGEVWQGRGFSFDALSAVACPA